MENTPREQGCFFLHLPLPLTHPTQPTLISQQLGRLSFPTALCTFQKNHVFPFHTFLNPFFPYLHLYSLCLHFCFSSVCVVLRNLLECTLVFTFLTFFSPRPPCLSLQLFVPWLGWLFVCFRIAPPLRRCSQTHGPSILMPGSLAASQTCA